MDLLEIRGRLDQIDTQIEKLFEERMRLCSEVAEYKIATGKAVYDAEREKQKIESVQAMAEGEFTNQAGAELEGVGIAIEKGFQPGRKVLEEKGARVESLAIIEKMGNGTITFKEQDD